MKKFLAGLLVLGLLFFGGCQKTIMDSPDEQSGFFFDTPVTIKIYDRGKKAVLNEAFEELAKLHDQWNLADPASELSQINAAAGIAPVTVAAETYQLLVKAKQYSQTYEKFDLTIGPVTQLWGIGSATAKKPAATDVVKALTLVNSEQVQLDADKQTVFLMEKGMQLDIGSLGKGYATDKIVKLFKQAKVTTAVLDLGGNIYVLGESTRGNGQPWQVGIRDPQQANAIIGEVAVTDQTIVTSGTYQRYLQSQGTNYHHIFDPTTGYPIDNQLSSVTIVTDSSLTGDALSTVAFTAGLTKGLAMIEELPATEALFVTKDQKIYRTSGLEKNFTQKTGTDYRLK
ncbi:FAD:protein FMN transferase [Enterococcus hailinensis]|uniref:FAD:protein FMN transferase n=1 Tax=Enterococcus hailinensis TaxID=3238988 RepID=UPI0038B2CC3F